MKDADIYRVVIDALREAFGPELMTDVFSNTARVATIITRHVQEAIDAEDLENARNFPPPDDDE